MKFFHKNTHHPKNHINLYSIIQRPIHKITISNTELTGNKYSFYIMNILKLLYVSDSKLLLLQKHSKLFTKNTNYSYVLNIIKKC